VGAFLSRPTAAGKHPAMIVPGHPWRGSLSSWTPSRSDDVTPLSEVEEFRATLEKGNKEHEIHLYPGAGHAFTNDMHPERYHAEATEISWTRTLEFLSKHLKNSPGKS